MALSPPRTAAGLLLLFVLVPTHLLPGCGGEESADTPEPPARQTLLFVDRSASTGAYPDAEDLFADSLRHLVRTRMKQPGDRLSLFIVHEKTLSKSPRLDLENTVRPLEEKDFSDEQALETARFKKELEREFRRLTEKAQAFIDDADGGDFAQWTDLWGTLGVASEELVPQRRTAIYYFSDMYESMPGEERRNFDRRPPADREQATAWARADIEALPDEMILRPERLRNTKIRVLMGPLATKSGAQPVKFYWLELFNALGIDAVDYN